MSAYDLDGYFVNALDGQQFIDHWPINGAFGEEADAGAINLAPYLLVTDIQNMTINLAETLTNQIRSIDPGDNANTTMLAGTAVLAESYITVRWPWLILPLAETALTLVLLAVSIYATRKQPLFKDSLVAVLLHGLEGGTQHELQELVEGVDSVEKLNQLAQGITVRFEKDSKGKLVFVRV